MTFEERIDRLTLRHEALAQTVEHMAIQGEEQNKRILLQSENIDRILAMVENLVRQDWRAMSAAADLS